MTGSGGRACRSRRMLWALVVLLLLAPVLGVLTAPAASAAGSPRTIRTVTNGVTTYRITSGYDLDEYLYRASNPLDFAFETRPYHARATDSSGYPTPSHPLFGRELRLTVLALDVDEEQGEIDDIYFNGHRLGSLAGVNGQWSVTTFHVPANHVKFGPYGTNPVQNDVEVDIDVNAQGWAVEVAWAELTLDAGPEPVVMVHGLNGGKDSDSDGFNDKFEIAGDYYVDREPRLADRLAAPLLTGTGGVGIDGPLLEDAVDELLDSTGFARVNMLAHSFGGLTARRYAFDNPGRVGTLVMAATPNGGSEVATDLCNAQRRSGWGKLDVSRWPKILGNVFADAGHCSDETSKLYQLQQWYVRGVFNDSVRDSDATLPDRTTTDYYTIAGKAGNPLSGILNGEDDGNVEVSSVFWLRPADSTADGALGDNPKHPGRHTPYSLHHLKHPELVERGSPLGAAYCLHNGRIDASTCPIGDDNLAPMSMSAAGIVTQAPSEDEDIVAAPAFDVPGGQTTTVDLGLTGRAHATILLFSDASIDDLTATVDNTPLADAGTIVPALAASVTDTPGQLTVENRGASPATIGALVFAPVEHPMTVDVDRTRARPGEPVEVIVRADPAAGAPEVTATLATDTTSGGVPVPVSALGGGVWLASFAPPGPGTWLVDAWTTAPAAMANAVVRATDSGAQITGAATTSTTDENQNGLYDELLVDVEVDVTDPDGYRLTGELVAADGTPISSVTGTASLTAGAGLITVRGSGRAIYEHAADGPYRLTDVVLTRDDAAFTLSDFADRVATTTAYLHGDFEHDPVQIDRDGIREAEPVDADADGLIDAIVVHVPVIVDRAGSYHVNARLRAPDGSDVTDVAGVASLTAGKTTVELKFPAEPIGTGDFDTTFELTDLVTYRVDNVDVFDYVTDSITTASYHSNQMEGFPVAPARNAKWRNQVTVTSDSATVSGGLATDTTNDTTLEATWEPSVGSVEQLAGYRVDLSTDEAFNEIVASKTLDVSARAAVFDETDSVTPGHRYWFRVLAVSVPGTDAAPATSTGLAVTSRTLGPLVEHVPVPLAYSAQNIPITATSTCTAGNECTARLYWRPTPNGDNLADQTTAALGGSWQVSGLTRAGATTIADQEAITWSGTIPARDVTTAGVDYFIEADEDLAITRTPGGTFIGTDGDPDIDANAPDIGFWHVQTVNPPIVVHQPTLFARTDEAIPISAQATCSTGDCTARLYFRSGTGSISDETVVGNNGELFATPDWPSVPMDRATLSTLGEPGEVLTFTAEIPAAVVDTRGVDYFIEVTDGTTQTWSPGTTYQGYYAPVDGMRTGWHHVHILEPPHTTHVPPPVSDYRADIPITASATCPARRACTARLFFRTTQSDVLDTTSPFESVPMGALRTPLLDGSGLLTLTGTIPGRVADTRGVDYFFSVSDGSTTTWWPGTSQVDGYMPVEGIRVGYHHIRVLEPPHITHVPGGAAPALEDLLIDANAVCVTEQCELTLHYRIAPGTADEERHSIPMAPVGPLAPGLTGSIASYRATIPADHVTTAQLSYHIEAFDGYTHGFAPGTSYSGAYLPTDGMPVGSFPVRVLEPPHIVHIPKTTATDGEPLELHADANCATGACAGTVHWRDAGGVWQQTSMTATVNGTVAGMDLVSFTVTLPGVDVHAGLQYWIGVTDGYVEERTPTWSLTVTTT